MVAKSYNQIQGDDFNDVFSPVVKHDSIYVLLALVVMYDLKLKQFDVKVVFLHGEFEKKII